MAGTFWWRRLEAAACMSGRRALEHFANGAGIRAMLDKPVEPDRLYGVRKSFLN